MNTMSTRDKIIELAQEAIATRGYSAFSFRELAAELGIKSASIHYHFPTKTHLGVEVAKTYRLRLESALSEIESQYLDPSKALEAMIAIFRQEAATTQRMTVCTMLAAEIKNLPEEIQLEMKAFYELNIRWVETLLDRLDVDGAPEKARQIFALLQGGLIGAKGQGSPQYFDTVMKAASQFIP